MSRSGKQTHLGDALGKVLGKMDRKSAGAYAAVRVRAAWESVAGAMVSGHTTGAHLRDGELVVYVDGSTWANELAAMSETYRVRLNSELGQDLVRSVRFSVSRKVEAQRRVSAAEDESGRFYDEDVVDPIPLTQTERARVEESVSGIPDEGLREAVLRATVKDLEWKKGLDIRNGRVVRTLATTAIRIPMKPAESEQNAPITKPMAVGRSLKMKSKMKMITAIELIVIT